MVLKISLALVGIFVFAGIFWPTELAEWVQILLTGTLERFGWFYLLSMFLFLVFALFCAFSRFGTIRLGGEEAEPEFSTASWFAMLFAAGMGIGLVFWGAAEPLSHFGNPPMSIEPLSAQAARVALRSTFFHWGLHPWAAYSVVGLSLAFFRFNRNQPMLISSVFVSEKSTAWAQNGRRVVDVLAIIATVFGVATSLGLGTLQIGAGLQHVLGVPNGLPLQFAIIGVAAALYLTSAMTGLTRGIQILSNVNMGVAILLLTLLFLGGPTAFILDSMVTTLGDYLNNLVSMSMRLTPFTRATWVANWTLFYWAWWIAWSPFVGMFIARISKGRTIREFVVGVLLAPSLVSFAWFSTFGGAALNQAMFHSSDLVGKTQEDVTMALFGLLESLPLPTITSVIAIVLVSVFFVTSADSATFVLGMMSSRGNEHPSNRIKLAWGLLMALIAAVLLFAGGLKGLQTMSILTALPFAFVMLAMMVNLYRELRREDATRARLRREKERALEALLASKRV